MDVAGFYKPSDLVEGVCFADLYRTSMVHEQRRHMVGSNFSHPITERMFMKLIRTSLITSVLLAGLCSMSFAQMGLGSGSSGHEHMAKMHERMAQRHTQHLAELKTQLKLEKEQESAWTIFSQSMQGPRPHASRPDRAAMEKLTTPERLDLMQKHHAQMDIQMQKHIDASKAFYAVLTADQKKVFDTASAKFLERGHKEHHRHH